MKEALNSLSFNQKFCGILYILILLFVTRMIFSCVFLLQYVRKKSKRLLFNFPTLIAVTLEHIHILITTALKLSY